MTGLTGQPCQEPVHPFQKQASQSGESVLAFRCNLLLLSSLQIFGPRPGRQLGAKTRMELANHMPH